MAIAHNRFPLRATVLAGVAGIGLSASSALAVLGSCGPNEGYNLSMFQGSANWCDVTYYNAGAYGPAAGNNPGPFAIAPNSGQWRVTSQVGGFYPNAAARNAAVGGAPPYPSSATGTIPAYIVGAHFNGHNNDGYNLAVRNDTPAGTGALRYEYDLDIYDTGGPVPSSITSGVVTSQFYFMTDPDVPYHPGTPRQDKFTMSFIDSVGNVGLQWGYSRDNTVAWRQSPSGSWNYTAIQASAASWDGVKVSMDLTNGTFSIDYYDDSSATWSNIVPSGTVMGQAMTNFTTMGWQLEDAVNLGIGGKNFFDDFTFSVPAPSSAVLLAMGCGALARRRRN